MAPLIIWNVWVLSLPPLHSLSSVSYTVCFRCLIGVHVPWLNVSFSFRWQRPCSTSWFWTVFTAYRLTHNAKNMWRWKQPFNCFVWGRRKTRKHKNDEGTRRHRPTTHHSQQSYLMTLGSRGVSYSCRRVGLEETAAFLINIFDIEKS